MSSYNNIRKIKYTKNPSDVVSLYEYILFEDLHAKEKYVVFKFSNNVNQQLFDFKFEVLQYNADNELIEKSTVAYNNSVAQPNELFVPNAKLKVNFDCCSLEVNLEEASFDRVVWSGGEFKDNSYRFDTYAQSVAAATPQASAVKELKKPQKEKKNKRRNKLGFNIRNIFRRNKAAFPAVFNVIVSVIFVALVVLSAFYFKKETGAFAADGYVLKESSSGYVTVLQYTGDEENLVIPDKIKDCYVTKIDKGAFVNAQFKTVVINTSRSLVIETGAFKNCKNLVSVTGGGECSGVTVLESAFTDCASLTDFYMPTAKLGKQCFDGTDSIKNLYFNDVLFSGGKLLDLFNNLDSLKLNSLYIAAFAAIPVSFLENVTIG